MPLRLKECAGWYFRMCVRVRHLRRESSTCGWGGWVPTHWVGVGSEEGRLKKNL